jgi:NAD(P)-dependent dehydrogenase (short-subunit alcohol dehydrogenase family)
MTKAALTGLVRGAAIDLAPRGISVNNVQPGPTATEMSAPHVEMVKPYTPLRRMGEYWRVPASSPISRRKKRASSLEPVSPLMLDTSRNQSGSQEEAMARPKEFDQEKALRSAVRLFSQQGFAATSIDELM